MIATNKSVLIVGNGLSRKSFNFVDIKGASQCPLYACNLGYTDLPYDKVFAIDDGVIAELKSKNIAFQDVPEEMKWEPAEYRSPSPRNNTGMVAMQYAINEGYTELLCFGFDFLLDSAEKIASNVFEGHHLYGAETKCSIPDSYARRGYLGWMMAQNPDVKFHFIFPEQK